MMGMTRRALLASSAAVALMNSAGLDAQIAMPSKPNIIVILADDQGYSDWGCMGSEIPTPNIDALAAGGLKFTTFYNTPKCSPSRASLLTGTYPHQAGLGHLEQYAFAGSQGIKGYLLDRVATIAELLKGSGYFTAMAGKWHLGVTRGVGPWDRGFDRSLCSPQGRMYFPDQTTRRSDQSGNLYRREILSHRRAGGRKGRVVFRRSVCELRHSLHQGSAAKGDAFYLVLALRQCTSRANGSAKRILTASGANTRPDGMQCGKHASRDKRRWEFSDPRKNCLLANRIRMLGASLRRISRIISTISWPPTLPMSLEWTRRSALWWIRSNPWANSTTRSSSSWPTTVPMRKPAPTGSWKRRLRPAPDGKLVAQRLGGPHSSVELGMEWATMSDTPFRYFKQFTYEGGISTPLIVHWPRGIDSSLNGTLVRELSHLIDVVPTLLELTGTKYPASYNGHELVPLSGRSFAPVFPWRAVGKSLRSAILGASRQSRDTDRELEAGAELGPSLEFVRHVGRSKRNQGCCNGTARHGLPVRGAMGYLGK